MPRVGTGPRSVEFKSIKKLVNRMNPEETGDEDISPISASDDDVPSWQRNVVWTEEEMGLLALSILQNYPIGLVILWKKPDGVRVPIDGRQRLTAIDSFIKGDVAIPDLPGVPEEYKNAKYVLRSDDAPKYKRLPTRIREDFEDYEPQIVEFERIDEATAMDIFIKLQGGKSLTKTEVRAALGGRICDFVTELTSPSIATTEDDEEENEPSSHHPFFAHVNLRNVRKAHRNLCDVLLHEYLFPGLNKHWSSLEALYRDKSTTLTEGEKNGFRTKLGQFQRACSYTEGGTTRVLPQLRSAFLILSFFRAWQAVETTYSKPAGYRFADVVRNFEALREEKKNEVPWVNFTAALSNAGYSEGRIKDRHIILMSYILKTHPEMVAKDNRRTFTEEQKIAIWERAGHRCEYTDDEQRCEATFPEFRLADADHIVRWIEGGATSLSNGRLLCQAHNRGRAS